MNPTLLIAPVLALSALPAAASGNVWRVSQNDPTADFSWIQPAVDAAADGDTILIQPIVPVAKGQGTSYAGFTIDGKALRFAADAPPFPGALSTPIVDGTVTVRNLPAGGEVVLRGILMSDAASLFGGASPLSLVIEDSDGFVLVEDTIIDQRWALFGVPAVTLSNSQAVSFVRCRVEGAIDPPLFPVVIAGEPGILAQDSGLHLFETEVFGGHGASSPFFPEGGVIQIPKSGAAGLRMEGGHLFASGCTIRGGDGGSGATVIGCVDSARGGDGIQVLAGAIPPVVGLLDSHLRGGFGGAAGAGCTAGQDGMGLGLGLGIWTAAAEVSALAGTARSAAIDSPLREGELGTLSLRGEAAELVLAIAATSAAPLYVESLLGILVPTLGSPVLFLGVTDGGGSLDLPIGAPGLAQGVEAAGFHIQAAFLSPSILGLQLSSPTWLTVLDKNL